MSSQFRPWMVMVNSFVTALVFMLAFTSALLWCLVATTHRSVVHAEGRFYCFCFASRYIRTKLHPFKQDRRCHQIRKPLLSNLSLVKSRFLDPNNPRSPKKDFYNPNVLQVFDTHYVKR